MEYLIDSDWAIDHLEEIPPARQLLASLAPRGIAISIITYAEAYHGVVRSPDRFLAERKLVEFLEGVPVLFVTFEVARTLAGIREHLRLQGRPYRRRAFDLVIAATAVANDLTLVTRNFPDYRDVPGLRLYEPR